MSHPPSLVDLATEVAAQFAIDTPVRAVTPRPGGHIHDSFVVATSTGRWFLQRMNTRVFPSPERVMENIAAVTDHVARAAPDRRRSPGLVRARAGGWLVRDAFGGCWRMFTHVDGATSREEARGEADAAAAARAFGQFQRRLSDYDGPPLHVTIPGFHDTPSRLEALRRAAADDRLARARGAEREIAFAEEQHALAHTLADAQDRGELPLRIAHHDAKIANVLFDETDGEVVCVVDLDTVMPGSSLYDLGDLVRSMVSAAREDEPDPRRVTADPTRFGAIVRGYLDGVDGLLSEAEHPLLPMAPLTMVYEQGVRFLTDHLDGDAYYRIERPAQNLDRARAQFALLASLQRQHDDLWRTTEWP